MVNAEHENDALRPALDVILLKDMDFQYACQLRFKSILHHYLDSADPQLD